MRQYKVKFIKDGVSHTWTCSASSHYNAKEVTALTHGVEIKDIKSVTEIF